MADSLEVKAMKAVLKMEAQVGRMAAILEDVGLKLTHVLERRFDYYTLPEGFDYREGYKPSRR